MPALCVCVCVTFAAYNVGSGEFLNCISTLRGGEGRGGEGGGGCCHKLIRQFSMKNINKCIFAI